MSFALRALVMLAAVTPLFAATRFHAAWWQILVAAMLGSALGQVAVRATRGRRVAAWSVMAVAALVALTAAGWLLTRDDSPGGGGSASREDFLVVRSKDGAWVTSDDVRAIKTLPSVRFAVPYLGTQAQLVGGADVNWQTQVVGTTPDYFDLRTLRVAAGDRFAAESAERVVVLGDTVVKQLFGAGKDAVGEVVRIKTTPFTIVGVLAHQGMSPQGQDLDDVALVPIDAYTSRFPASGFGGAVLVSPTARGDASRLEAELRSLLRERHRLAPGADDDFLIRSSRD